MSDCSKCEEELKAANQLLVEANNRIYELKNLINVQNTKINAAIAVLKS